MVKKILILGVMVVMALSLTLSLAGCGEKEEAKELLIPFVLSDKTTDYFSTEPLLQLVNSYEELTALLMEKEFTISPMYEEAFFDENSLVLYFFTVGIYNEILEISLEAKKDIIVIYVQYDLPGGMGMDALRPWAFLIEVDKADLADLTILQAN